MTSRFHCNAHDHCFCPLIPESSFQHCWRRLGPFLRFQTIYVASCMAMLAIRVAFHKIFLLPSRTGWSALPPLLRLESASAHSPSRLFTLCSGSFTLVLR